MFGKTQTEHTKILMSIKKSIRPLGLYDEIWLKNILIK